MKHRLGRYPDDVKFVQSCIKESAEKFDEQKRYESLDKYNTRSNLFVSVLNQLGIEDHTFGNSTSSLKGLEIG